MAGGILIVEATFAKRIALKMRLVSACHETTTARNAAEALTSLSLQRPHLVLIGGVADQTGAADLCRRILDRTGGRVPVIVIAQGVGAVAALRAGAAAVIDGPDDTVTLLARIRGLLRDHVAVRDSLPAMGLAEEAAVFEGTPPAPRRRPSVLLVAERPAGALLWKKALTPRLGAEVQVGAADRALAEAASGRVPDIYMIAADIALPGDGLRLLSELRSRPASEGAGFMIVLPAERMDMTAVALDLGAGDVVAMPCCRERWDEVAPRLEALIARKQAADARRAALERERGWAQTDPLTGLPNRRHALPRIADLCGAAQGGGRGFSVVALDIDRFKRVNDVHGHAAGDAVLASVAARLRDTVGASGFVARMGGEEFLAVLPGASRDEAAALAERMRWAVGWDRIVLPRVAGGGTLSVTISAGVAGCSGAAEAWGLPAADRLLDQADRALMAAKAHGGNRLMIAQLGAAA